MFLIGFVMRKNPRSSYLQFNNNDQNLRGTASSLGNAHRRYMSMLLPESPQRGCALFKPEETCGIVISTNVRKANAFAFAKEFAEQTPLQLARFLAPLLRNITLCHREETLFRRRDLPHVKVEIASQTTLAMTGLVFLSF